jgi:hypothetical protein
MTKVTLEQQVVWLLDLGADNDVRLFKGTHHSRKLGSGWILLHVFETTQAAKFQSMRLFPVIPGRR